MLGYRQPNTTLDTRTGKRSLKSQRRKGREREEEMDILNLVGLRQIHLHIDRLYHNWGKSAMEREEWWEGEGRKRKREGKERQRNHCLRKHHILYHIRTHTLFLIHILKGGRIQQEAISVTAT